MSGYIGSTPVPQATQHRESFTATEGQTTFNTAGYTPQFVDVYLNGSHLSPADFTATNGSDVVLGVAASADDVCDIISYTPFEVAGATFTGTTTMTDVVAASLDISGNIDIDGVTNLDVVDIDGAVNMATTALVTGVLTTTAATVFNGGFAAGGVGTFADGSAGAPSITNTGDLNTGILFPAADTVGFSTAGAERARITSAGHLCIGSSDAGNAAQRTINIGAAGSVDGGIQVWARTSGSSFLQFGDTTSSADNYRGYIGYNHGTDRLQLGSTSVTRMTIDGGGLAYIGTVAGGGQFNVHALGDRAVITARVNANGDTCFTPLNASGTGVGNILANASSTTYATSSDYRLKENVDYTWDATTRLKQLKPARFNFIIDDTNTLVDGFLAHEVSGIVPEAVNGTHNETKTLTKVVLSSSNTVLAEDIEQSDWTAGKSATTDRDGDAVAAIYPSDSTWAAEHVVPKMQGIDQSKLVPLLVKTILELEARITALEG